jgi:hypothetical protein
MKKIFFAIGLSTCLLFSGCSKHTDDNARQRNLHFREVKKDSQGSPKIMEKNQSENTLDDPSYVSGAFNFYNADRDPTSSEPVIITGLLDPSQILLWKNIANGNLWYLINATSDSPAVLTWVEIYSSGSK